MVKKYSDTDVERIRDQYAMGVPVRAIADGFKCSGSEINLIVKGHTYKHVKGPLPAVTRPRTVDGAELLAWQLNAAGGLLAQFQREHTIIPGRKFRWDITYPRATSPLAIEVQGYGRAGARGAHQTYGGMRRDAEKSALLAINGWRYMAVTTDHVRSGVALGWIEQALT